MEIIPIIFAIFLLLIAICSKNERLTLGNPQQAASIKYQLEELAYLAWSQDESSWSSKFSLNSRDLANAATPERVIEILLNHARQVTPRFSIPWMVPHTVVEPIPQAAGLFQVDTQGWVTVKLSPAFYKRPLAKVKKLLILNWSRVHGERVSLMDIYI